MTGTILTWVIFAVILVGFGIGLKHIYHNFISGESDCCGGGSKSNCANCGGGCATTDKEIIKQAEAKLKAENKVEALHRLEAAEKTEAKKRNL